MWAKFFDVSNSGESIHCSYSSDIAFADSILKSIKKHAIKSIYKYIAVSIFTEMWVVLLFVVTPICNVKYSVFVMLLHRYDLNNYHKESQGIYTGPR